MLLQMLFVGLSVVTSVSFRAPVVAPAGPEVAVTAAADPRAARAAELRRARTLADQGRLVAALAVSREVLRGALAEEDASTLPAARAAVEELLARLPHVKFVADPAGGEPAEVRVDGRLVPGGGLAAERWSIDPGHHVVVARSVLGGDTVTRTFEIDLPEGATAVIPVAGPGPLASK